MIKKLTALFLVLLLSLCVVACSPEDKDAPEDMKSATLEGEPFRLYVPASWTLNTSSGVSGAYPSAATKIMVTARYYTPADSAMTVESYLAFCVASYEKSLTSFKKVGEKAAVLGGKNARRLDYTMVSDEVELTCFQITVKYEGDMVSLYGYCPTDSYEATAEEFDLIIKEFVLSPKTEPQGEELVDKNTPEGMEIASDKNSEYRLYVPKTWICNAESGVSEAYYPESGKSNVLVTSYIPKEAVSVPDYFASCEKEYKATLPAYERVSETKRTVAGQEAHTYVYTTVVDGVEFRISQTLFSYSDSIYSFTYTAIADNFDLHTADVEAMLNAFTFR